MRFASVRCVALVLVLLVHSTASAQSAPRLKVCGPARVDVPRIWFTRIVRADGTQFGNVGAGAAARSSA